MDENNLTYDKIVDVEISDKMKSAYIDYAMSVIVSRALPDVRDGLKPVHRRILFDMNELHLDPSKGYKKSARIVVNVPVSSEIQWVNITLMVIHQYTML